MSANLPPEYYEAEERFRDAGTPEEKIYALEEVLTTIPKHKGTDRIRADYRRKLSKLKAGLDTKKKGGKHTSAFHVEKEGPARVIVIGAPNVGKSALIAAVTHATPKVSQYPFTTWKPVPGMMPIRDIQIQLIDTPAISQEHVEPELFGLIRTADFALLLVDIQGRSIQQLDDTIGLLDKYHITLQQADSGLPERGKIVCLPCIVLVTKTDDPAWDEEFDVFRELLEDQWPLLAISAQTGRNLDQLKETLFDRLELMRVYSKQPGKEADHTAPFVLRRGDTIAEFAAKVHKDVARNLKTARIWGTGVHDGQQVSRDHTLHDGDIVELRV